MNTDHAYERDTLEFLLKAHDDPDAARQGTKARALVSYAIGAVLILAASYYLRSVGLARWLWVGLAAAAVLVAAVTIQVSRQGDGLETGGPEPVEVTSVEAATSYALVSEEVRVRNGLQQVREDLLRSIIELANG